jgi:hypothetical protein
MFCRRLVRWIEDGFGKRELQHNLPFVVGYFEDCIQHARLTAFGFQQLSDRGSRNLPGVIGIAQILTLGVEDQFLPDPGVEVISWHERGPSLLKVAAFVTQSPANPRILRDAGSDTLSATRRELQMGRLTHSSQYLQ